jgi:hypothetical protein
MVMVQTVDAYFETASHEILSHFRRSLISSFRHKVERRAETSLLLDLREPKTPFLSNRSVNIVRDHEGKSSPVGPPFPAFGRTPGAFKNWPNRGHAWQLPSRNHLPKANLHAPRNNRLGQEKKFLKNELRFHSPLERTDHNTQGTEVNSTRITIAVYKNVFD